MSADTHEQRIGIMSTSQSLLSTPPAGDQRFGHQGSPRLPVMLIGVSLAEIAEIAGIEVRRFGDLACPDFTSENPARYPRAPEGAPKWT
jgi:hypothetical protein